MPLNLLLNFFLISAHFLFFTFSKANERINTNVSIENTNHVQDQVQTQAIQEQGIEQLENQMVDVNLKNTDIEGPLQKKLEQIENKSEYQKQMKEVKKTKWKLGVSFFIGYGVQNLSMTYNDKKEEKGLNAITGDLGVTFPLGNYFAILSSFQTQRWKDMSLNYIGITPSYKTKFYPDHHLFIGPTIGLARLNIQNGRQQNKMTWGGDIVSSHRILKISWGSFNWAFKARFLWMNFKSTSMITLNGVTDIHAETRFKHQYIFSTGPFLTF